MSTSDSTEHVERMMHNMLRERLGAELVLYLIVMIPDICTLTYFERMMHNMLRERLGGELVLYKGLHALETGP